MIGVSRVNRVRNDEVWQRMGVGRRLSDRLDQRVLGWFGHMERMDEERQTKKVWRAGVSGVRPRGRPRTRWMNGVKRALGARGLSVEQGRESATDRDRWRVSVNE